MPENTVGKKDLIAAIALQSGLSKKDAALALDSFCDVTTEFVKSGRSVHVPKLGTFEKTHHKERQGQHIQTKEAMVISASFGMGFHPAANVKKELNE